MTTNTDFDRLDAQVTEIYSSIKKVALAALEQADLQRYYDPKSGYAGSLFLELGVNPPNDIIPADLLALRTLSINMDVAQIRRALLDSTYRAPVLETLETIDPELLLEDATRSDIATIWELTTALKAVFNDPSKNDSDHWVGPAKLAARKRPKLIPVRDSVVRDLLQLSDIRDGRAEILTIQRLIKDPAVAATLENRHASLLQNAELSVDSEPLRVLDAALWCFAQGMVTAP